MIYKSEKFNLASTYIRKSIQDSRFLSFYTLFSIGILYLNLIWKTTGNIDRLTTDCLFWGVILWLLWKQRNSFKYCSNFISSFIGFILLGLILAKAVSLFDFESNLLSLLPIAATASYALILSGFGGINQYAKELFFAWFLFFPTGVIGHFLDKIFQITVINAKVATYLLYYFGFNTRSRGNEVWLHLPKLGNFKAIVDYPCAGIPMILLILKLALLFICCVSLSKKQQLLFPTFSVTLGFLLGVVRVCLLTLLIPKPTLFDYWHGHQGSQMFSTLAIVIFSGFCYLILEKDKQTAITPE